MAPHDGNLSTNPRPPSEASILMNGYGFYQDTDQDTLLNPDIVTTPSHHHVISPSLQYLFRQELADMAPGQLFSIDASRRTLGGLILHMLGDSAHSPDLGCPRWVFPLRPHSWSPPHQSHARKSGHRMSPVAATGSSCTGGQQCKFTAPL